MQSISASYPGEFATAEQIRLLADEYRKAALVLQPQGCRGKPLTRAPFRLSATHAIELYLNALLLHLGHSSAEIRRMQHDLWVRAELAMAEGLRLRVKTAEHLECLSRTREYLVIRYGPELAGTASQVNRLTATLDEVASKVAIICQGPGVRRELKPIGYPSRPR